MEFRVWDDQGVFELAFGSGSKELVMPHLLLPALYRFLKCLLGSVRFRFRI